MATKEILKNMASIPPATVRFGNGISVHVYDSDGKYIATYSSVYKAASDLGIADAGIWNCLKGKQHQSHGYQFRRAERD